MELNFINGKAIIKSGRKVIAKVYFRPDFFKGLNVNWDKNFPYCLELNDTTAIKQNEKWFAISEFMPFVKDLQNRINNNK